MNIFNLSPVEVGDSFRKIDDGIKATVAQKVAEGVPGPVLRDEFEKTVASQGLSPADAGSFLRVFDEALRDAKSSALPAPGIPRLP